MPWLNSSGGASTSSSSGYHQQQSNRMGSTSSSNPLHQSPGSSRGFLSMSSSPLTFSPASQQRAQQIQHTNQQNQLFQQQARRSTTPTASHSPDRSSVAFAAANVAMQQYARAIQEEEEGNDRGRGGGQQQQQQAQQPTRSAALTAAAAAAYSSSSSGSHSPMSVPRRSQEQAALLRQYQNPQERIRIDPNSSRSNDGINDDGIVFSPYNRRANSSSEEATRDRDQQPFIPVQSSASSYVLSGGNSSSPSSLPLSRSIFNSASRSSATANHPGSSKLYDPRALSLSAARLAVATAQQEDYNQKQQIQQASSSSSSPPPSPPNRGASDSHHYYGNNNSDNNTPSRSPSISAVPMPHSIETPPRPPMPALSESQLRSQGFPESEVHALLKLQRDLHRGHEVLRSSSTFTENVVNSINNELAGVAQIADKLAADLEQFRKQVANMSPMRGGAAMSSQVSLPPPGWQPSPEDLARSRSSSVFGRAGSAATSGNRDLMLGAAGISQLLRASEPTVAKQLSNPLPTRR